jgi:hypothetical protein
MIRELAVAAAAAAVGYAIGQRAAESPESRFSKPEVTGDEVAFEDDEIELCDDPVRRSRADIDKPSYEDWEQFDDDEVVGR